MFTERIHAGFESPAADYEEARIDLNDYVSKYPEATFFAKVEGECMIGSGIFPDDLLVVAVVELYAVPGYDAQDYFHCYRKINSFPYFCLLS